VVLLKIETEEHLSVRKGNEEKEELRKRMEEERKRMEKEHSHKRKIRGKQEERQRNEERGK
jgi:divalent metal cation (Fe/Co/Zn/Cd) transporter